MIKIRRHSKYFALGMLIGFWFGLFAEHFVTYAAAQGYPGVTIQRNKEENAAPRRNRSYTIPQNRDSSSGSNREIGPYDYSRNRGTPTERVPRQRRDDRAPQQRQDTRDTRQVGRGQPMDHDLAFRDRVTPPGFENVHNNYRQLRKQLLHDITTAYSQSGGATAYSMQQRAQMADRAANKTLQNFSSGMPSFENMQPGEWLQWYIATQHDMVLRGPYSALGEPLTGSDARAKIREIETNLENMRKAIKARLKVEDSEIDKYDLGQFDIDFYKMQRKNYVKADKMAVKALDLLREKYK